MVRASRIKIRAKVNKRTFNSKLTGVKKGAKKALERVMKDIKREASTLAKQEITTTMDNSDKPNPANYIKHYRITRTKLSDKGVTKGIKTTHRAAKFLELTGTRPHVIKPRNNFGVLIYRSRLGILVITRQANHPGYRPKQFIIRAIHHTAKRAVTKFIRSIQIQLRRT